MSEFTKVDGISRGEIKVYALSTCGWCKKAKALLNSHKVEYYYLDVDKLTGKEYQDMRKEQLKLNPNGSFPTIVAHGQIICGYDEAAILNLINGK